MALVSQIVLDKPTIKRRYRKGNMVGGSKKSELQIQRTKFALFIRILMKRLQKSDSALYDKARTLIVACIATERRLHQISVDENRRSTLLETIEGSLREVVGEENWIRTHAYMGYYLRTKGRHLLATAPPPAATPTKFTVADAAASAFVAGNVFRMNRDATVTTLPTWLVLS